MIPSFMREMDVLPDSRLRRWQWLIGFLLALDGAAILVSAFCLMVYAILPFLEHGLWWAEVATIENSLDTPIAVVPVLTWYGGSKDFGISRRLDPEEAMTVWYDSDDQRPTELLIKRSDGEIYLTPYRSPEYPERMIISEQTSFRQAPADLKAEFGAQVDLRFLQWVGRGLLLCAVLPFIAFPLLAYACFRIRGSARRRKEQREPVSPL